MSSNRSQGWPRNGSTGPRGGLSTGPAVDFPRVLEVDFLRGLGRTIAIYHQGKYILNTYGNVATNLSTRSSRTRGAYKRVGSAGLLHAAPSLRVYIPYPQRVRLTEFVGHQGRGGRNGTDSRMTRPFNEHACLRDCLIRWHYGEIATAWPVPPGGTRVEDMHLLAVPPPVNNHLPAAGDCLLWRGPLTRGATLKDNVTDRLTWRRTVSNAPHPTSTTFVTAPFAFSPATSTKATPKTMRTTGRPRKGRG